MLSAGNKINELQEKIAQVKKELSSIKLLEEPKPEFIQTANLIRSNEYLTQEIQKQKTLLSLYDEYSKNLENLVLSTNSIRIQIKKLKSRTKSRKIKKKTKTRRKKPKRKIKKKTKTKRRKTKKRRR